MPFGILFIAFLIILRNRKIEDFYLKWSIGFLVIAMAIRASMAFVFMVLLKELSDKYQDDSGIVEFRWDLFFYKMQVITLQLPY